MAIIIAQLIKAVPPSVSVPPGQTVLKQVLQSDQPSEDILIEYKLASSHNYWFDDGTSVPRKSLTLSETIQGGGTQLSHPVHIIETNPHVAVQSLQIEEFITDANGGKQSTVIFLGII